MSTVDVIIVNWNSGNQLRECLSSVSSSIRHSFELRRVVVVDNASTDGSVNDLESIKLPLEIIYNSENRGFAAACNQGAKLGDSDYLLFLNPDTRLFKHSLEKAVAFMERPENKDVAILGIQLLDEDGKVSRTCARFPSAGDVIIRILGLSRLAPKIFRDFFMTDWDHQDTHEVDHVIGAFYLVRRPVFGELRGFDERFFVYLEDLDFSYRVSKMGWKSVYYAGAQAFHKGGGTSEQVKDIRLFYSLRSRILYSYKHFSRAAATAVLLSTLFIEPISRTVLGLIRLSASDISHTFRGYRMLWRNLPEIMKQVKRDG